MNYCQSLSLQASVQEKNSVLVFIDSKVQDYQVLRDGIISGAEAYILHPEFDGVEQITQTLAQYQNVESIHIVSHGAPGTLYLGNTELSLNNLENYTKKLQKWVNSNFSGQTPVLALYGCNVAADMGTAFLEKLHQLTKASIYASSTIVGNSDLGANWYLDVRYGKNTSNFSGLVFQPEVLAAYEGTFATGGDKYYTYYDSKEGAKGTVAFADISTNGDLVTVNRNQTSTTAINLPFTFNFYGITYNKIVVGENGGIAFRNSGTADFKINNANLPSDNTTAVPEYSILPFWDDLDAQIIGANRTGKIYSKSETDRFTVQWTNFKDDDANKNNITFQVVLHKNTNNIDFIYSTPNNGSSASIGLNNGTLENGKPVGIAYSFDTNKLNGVTSIRFVTEPQLITNSLSVKEGEEVTLSNSNLNAIDVDNNIDLTKITYTVTNLQNGEFRVNGNLQATFTQKDINDGSVKFIHNGTEFDPSFSITLSDGSNTSSAKPANIIFTKLNDNPVLADTINSANFNENSLNTAASIIGSNITLTDADSSDFSTGNLRINYSSSGGVEDQLSISSGSNGITLSNRNVSYNGTVFGSIDTTDNGDSGKSLVVNFTNTNATLAAVKALIQNLTYQNTSNTPNASRTISITINDGDGGTSTAVSKVINVIADNDAPVNTVPAMQTINEDEVLTFTGANIISVSDPDAGNKPIVVKLEATNGTLSLNAFAGLKFNDGDGLDDATLDFEGSITDINNALNGMSFKPTANYNGAASVRIYTQDLGNNGVAKINLTSDKTVSINVNAVNDAPVNTVPTAQTVKEDTDLVFSSANNNLIKVDDVDVSETPSGVVQVNLFVTKGSLTIASTSGITFASGSSNGKSSITFSGKLVDVNKALDGLIYRGNANVNGTDTLTIITDDLGNFGTGGSKKNEKSIGITIDAVNDAPVNTVPLAQAVKEDEDLIFSVAKGNAITISDVDVNEGTGELEVTLSATNGALTLADTTGLTFLSGTSNVKPTIVIKGAVSAINKALDGLGYRGNLNYNGADTLSITTNDLGNKGEGGILRDANKTVAITVTAVNDAPVNTIPGAQSIEEDKNLVFTTNNKNTVSVSDVDLAANAGDIQVILSVTQGKLILGQTTGLSFFEGNDSNSITLKGTQTNINNALEGLTYRGNQDFNGNDTLTIVTSDLGNTGVPGELKKEDTIQIKVIGVNDAPEITVPASQTVDEDTDLALTGIGKSIQVKDVDAAESNGEVEVKLSVAKGILTLKDTNGLTFDATNSNGKSNVTFRGKIADVNIALNNLVYRGNLNANGADTLTVTTSDLGNTGTGGILTDTRNVQITINPVNDDPVNTIPTQQTVDEDVKLIFSAANGNAISIADVDALEGNGKVEIKLSVGKGLLTLSNTSDLTFTEGDGVSDSQLTFTGTADKINQALNGLVYLGNKDSNSGANGDDTLAIFTSDLGNTGSGGTKTDTDTVTIKRNAINDAPTNTVPGNQSVDEDTDLALTGINAIKIQDIDAAESTGELEVKVSATKGALTLKQTTGLTFSQGDGATDTTMTFKGKVKDINNALEGLIYRGNQDFNGEDTLTIDTNDLGNTGAGGALTKQDTVKIKVNPVNDAPINTLPGAQTVNEDEDLIFSGARNNLISISDVDVNEGTGEVEVTLAVNKGVLSLKETTGLTFAANNMTGAQISFKGKVADVNKALDSLVYRGNKNYNGKDILTITTNDLNNTGSGGIQKDIDTVDITLIPVNDPPVNAEVPVAQSVNEDTSLIFNTANQNLIKISDVDVDGDQNGAVGDVQVTLEVTKGKVTLMQTTGLTFAQGSTNGSATVIVTGSVENINKALDGLGYVGNQDFNGEDSLTISINDKSNGGIGGELYQKDTVKINVKAINDAPLNTAPSKQSVKEDTDLAFSAANTNSLSIDDIDANEGTGETEVKLFVTKGSLTLQETTGLTFKEGNGNGNTAISFTGKLTDINKALASLTYRGNANFHGQDTLTITTNDKGNSGDGGALTDTDTVDITVTPVNDAPVNNVPQNQKVDENKKLIFSAQKGNAISVSDIDASEAKDEVEVTLVVSKGVLTLGQVAGITFKAGDGKANGTMTFAGKVADINKALEGIIYQGDKDYSGQDTLTVTTNDLGNFGSDILIDTDTIGISVIPDSDDDNISNSSEEEAAAEIVKQNPTNTNIKNLSQKAVSDPGVVVLFGQDGDKKPIIIAINEQDQKQLGGTSQTPALVIHSVTTQRFNDVAPDPIAAFDSKDLKKSSLKKLAPTLDVINFGVMPNPVIKEEGLQQKIKDGIKQKPVRVEIKLPDAPNDAPVNTILKRSADGVLYDFRQQFNPNRGDLDFDGLTGAVLQDRNLDGKADWAVVYLQDGKWGDEDDVDTQIQHSVVGANWDLGTSRMEARSSQDGLNFYGNSSYVQFTLDRFSGAEASEVGMARVRFGSDGQIIEVNGKAVKSTEEAKQAIIKRGETLFSSLSAKNRNPDIGSQTRTVAFEEGEQAVFFVVQNGTKDELLFKGLNSNTVQFSLSTLNNGAAIMTASNDERGQTAKLSLAGLFDVSAKVLTAEEARPQLGLFAVGQSQPQLNSTNELIDLKSSAAFDGKQVKLSLSLQREAAHNNSAYLFRVDDASGSIRDPLTGMLLDPTSGLSMEQKQRYLELATTDRLIQGTELQTPNQQTTEISVNLTGGEYYLPFLVSNGTLSTINKDFSRILTPCLGINSDGVDHIRSLGNNKFGFEDMIGGGDRDYNDMILSIKQVQIIA